MIITTFDEMQSALNGLGIEIPAGTIRRWASEGVIPSPSKRPGPKGGWLRDWPEEAVHEIAANWMVRKMDTWVKPTKEVIRKTREFANNVFEQAMPMMAENKLFAEGVLPNSQKGHFLQDTQLHSFIVTWLCTVEKVKQGWPITTPALVTLIWDTEGKKDEGTLCFRYVGATIEKSELDTVKFSSRRLIQPN